MDNEKMSSNLYLTVENMRCFSQRFTQEIRPLTILVGENSTGKSTFLAALAAVSESETFPGSPAIYREPYDLGNFETTATFKGGRAGRENHFTMGFRINIKGDSHEVLATYAPRFGEARLSSFSMKNSGASFVLKVVDDHSISTAITFGPTVKERTQRIDDLGALNGNFIGHMLFRSVWEMESEKGTPDRDSAPMKLGEVFRHVVRCRSLAPIRSEPKRTYDRGIEGFKPEGDHVPFEMAQLYMQGEDESAVKLKKYLSSFGLASNLFKKIEPKRLGSKEGDPFKMNVTVSGRPANMRDVGYGVSQALPIIFESVLARNENRVILQQPEVHLHPRAQAALGALFCRLVKEEKRQFVIETHSDYIIDRIRQEVAQGTLKNDSVALLYFQRRHMDTQIYDLHIDANGNIENAPESYREFFIQEQDALLNRSK